MKVELDKKSMDKVAAETIKKLEAQVRSLQRRLDARNYRIAELEREASDRRDYIRKVNAFKSAFGELVRGFVPDDE